MYYYFSSWLAEAIFADAKEDNPKAGADVGKIVNLMSTDVNQLVEIAFSGYFLYAGLYWSLRAPTI